MLQVHMFPSIPSTEDIRHAAKSAFQQRADESFGWELVDACEIARRDFVRDIRELRWIVDAVDVSIYVNAFLDGLVSQRVILQRSMRKASGM